MRGWAGWFLLLAAVLPFLASRNFPPVHDDVFLRGPGSLVTDPRASSAELWRADLFGTVEQPSGQTGFWRPLVLLSYRAEYLLSGGAEAPFAWLGHASNLLLHALASVALWRVLLLLELPAPAALAAAALFAVHPVHAEAVAWLAGRGELGATAMGFLGTALLLRPDGRARSGSALRAHLGPAFLLLAALLFKESAVLLLVLAALAGRRAGRSWSSACAAPALALLAYAALRMVLFTRAIAPDAFTGPAATSERWWTWLSIVPEALRLVLWPGPATPIHPVPTAPSWREPGVLAGAGALLLLGFLCVHAWRRRAPALSWGLMLITGTLLMLAPWLRFPTGFPEVAAPLYERYFYAAAAAPPVALAWLLRDSLARAPRIAAALTLIAVTAILPVATAAGNVWRSDGAFARAGLAVAPRSANLWNHLGLDRLELLRQHGDRAAGDEALVAFARALALDPGQLQAEVNRFITLAMLDRQDEASFAADRLLQHHPSDPDALHNVAQWHAAHRRWREAADLFEREIETGRARPAAAASLAECLRALQAAAQPTEPARAPARTDPNDAGG